MDKVEIFEKERAAGYNKFVETWIPNYHTFLEGLPRLFSHINPKELLVVGCGTGNEIAQFLQANGQWFITGVDPSPDMVNQAKERFQGFNNVRLIEGLVTAVDVEKKYNAATLLLVLHFLEDDGDKLNLLSNIAERLVSGASFVLLDITGDKQQIKQNLNILRLLLPEGIDQQEISNRLYRIENDLFPISEERLSEICVRAGFEPPVRFFQSSIYMGWLMTKK